MDWHWTLRSHVVRSKIRAKDDAMLIIGYHSIWLAINEIIPAMGEA